MVLLKRLLAWLFDWLGFVFCEAAFRTDCRGPFAYAYRLGCWFYGEAHKHRP